jgi:hypothetical protein
MPRRVVRSAITEISTGINSRTPSFVVNSENQPTMLLTFTTPGGPNSGPIQYLPGDGIDNMGMFSHVCVAK